LTGEKEEYRISLNKRLMKNTSQKPNTRKIQAQERRVQILDTALEVFARQGFRGSSIQDIARAAAISPGLLYHYFPSKDELLRAIIETHSYLPQLREVLEKRQYLPAKEVFEEIIAGFLRVLDKERNMVALLVRDVAFDPEGNDVWAEMCREGVALLENYLNGRIASGEFRPHNTKVTARCAYSIIIMFHLTQEIFKTNGVTREEFLKEAIQNLLKGIEAR